MKAWHRLTPVLVSLVLAVWLSYNVRTVDAQDALGKTGASCNVSNSLLLVASNQLMTDCGYLAWCDPSSSTCLARGCRKDEFPFGYSVVERSKWPPICDSGKFCPDEGSSCMNKIALGGACQLNRDDECATSTQHPQVRCLHNVCVAVNATLNGACVHENVVYTTFTPDNSSYGSIVSRDNCDTGLYCDSTSSVCFSRKAKLATCSADKECLTDFCQDNTYTAQTPDNNDDTGTCAEQPFLTAKQHRVWVYVVVVLVALVPMLLLILALLKLHQHQGAKRRSALQAYWDTQRTIQQKVQMYKEDLRSYAASPNVASYGSQSKLINRPNAAFSTSREELLDTRGAASPQTPNMSLDNAPSLAQSKLRHSTHFDDSLMSSPHLVRHHGEFNDGSGGPDDSDNEGGYESSSRPLSMQADLHWRRSHVGSTGNIAGMYDGNLHNSRPEEQDDERYRDSGNRHDHVDPRGSYTQYADAFHTPDASRQDLLNDSMEQLGEPFSASQASLPLSQYESVHGLSSTQSHGSPTQRVQHLTPQQAGKSTSTGLRNREGNALSSRAARQTGEGPSSPEARRENLAGDWSFFASEGHSQGHR